MPGQVLAPITYGEIQAFNATTFAGLTAWEVALIRRIDDAVRSVSIQKMNPTGQIPVKNGAGVAGMLRGIAAQKKGDS